MRVLLVEDDEDLRFGVAAALRAAGLAVDEAAELPRADEALFVTAYDCAVFDRMLPSGDAAAFVEGLRRDGRAVTVLFTASTSPTRATRRPTGTRSPPPKRRRASTAPPG